MRWLVIPLVLLLLPMLALPIRAEEVTLPDAEVVPDEYGDFLDAIPEDIRPLLPDRLFSSDRTEIGEGVREMSSLSYLLRTLLSLIGLRLGDAVAMLASITGLLLISAVSTAISSSFSSPGVARAFSFCSTLVILTALLSQSGKCLSGVANYFSTLGTLTAASIPLMAALYLLGGNTAAAVASSSGLSIFMTVTETVVGKSILPFCGLCMSLALVGALDPSIRLGTLLSAIKKNYTTALSFLMMLLLAMLSAQTLLGARSDTLVMRSARFATGTLIPVVGGSIAELLKTVSAGVGYLRGAVGICGVLLLLLTLLPTLVELLLYRLAWQISASLADILGCESERKLLDEFASLLGYLVAAVAICSSVLFLAFTLLTHCVSAIG